MRRSRALLVVVGVALVASACTGENLEPPESLDTPGSTEPAVETPDVGEASPTFGADPFEEGDQVLDVAIQEPSSLDPMRIQDPGSYLVARHLYEGLTRWDPGRLAAVPSSARSWRVHDGGRRFVFRLRSGLTFHDGSALTARDFVFAFDRIARKGSASDLAFTLERIVGFDAVNGAGTATHLAGVRAVDDLTLEIRLTQPYQDFPVVLSHPALVPLPRAAVADLDTFLAAPVGNGSFRIAEPWAPGQPVVLAAFPDFPRPPEIDGVRFLPFPDVPSAWIPFVRGDLDVAQVPVGEFLSAEEVYGDRGYQPLLNAYYYGFNLDAAAFRNRRVRVAINRAIDRAAIARQVFKGTMQAPRGIVPSGLPGFEENICLRLCSHAPKVAKRLVRTLPRRARRVTVEFTAGAPHAQVAGAVAQDLSAAGFSVRVRSVPLRRYPGYLRSDRHGFFRFGWIADYPLADEFLRPLFASNSSDNHTGFASPRVDALLARAHREPSADVRNDLYRRAETLILNAVPIVPIGSFTTHWAAQPEVEGIEFDQGGGLDATNVRFLPQG